MQRLVGCFNFLSCGIQLALINIWTDEHSTSHTSESDKKLKCKVIVNSCCVTVRYKNSVILLNCCTCGHCVEVLAFHLTAELLPSHMQPVFCGWDNSSADTGDHVEKSGGVTNSLGPNKHFFSESLLLTLPLPGQLLSLLKPSPSYVWC